jgi:cell fate (sporulation/competence/biofilm development) regulator YmcA (YheA/YmcA/DUF963 family)
MKYLEELKHKLCEEMDIIAKKGEMSMSDLDKVQKMASAIKNLDKIKMYEEYSDEGEEGEYSERRGRGRNARRDSMGRYSREGGSSYRGGSYADGGSYAEDGGSYGDASYRRGGYSRASAKEHMLETVEELMEKAENVREREALQKCMKELKNLQ